VYLGTTAEDGSDLESIAVESVGATSASVDDNVRLQQELAQLRTGDDAVRFFARHSNNSLVQVLYCNRLPQDEDSGVAACSLVIVPEHKVKPEHFTVSASGVFHICPGEMSECTPLSEWMHHGMLHSVLKSMPFFKQFVRQKNFEHWRRNARYEGFCRQRQRLNRSCFLVKPLFVGPLAKLQKLVSDVERLPLLNLTEESQRLTDFATSQLEVRSSPVSGARAELERKHDMVLELLNGLVMSVQQAFAAVSTAQDQGRHRSKGKSMAQEKEEGREQARKLQSAERDLASVGSFVRLADYMFQGARVASVMDAAYSFSRRLSSDHRMFSVAACFERDGVVLSPSREEFTRELSRLWEGILQAVSPLPTLTSNSRLKDYVAADLRKGETVEDILCRCGVYKKEIDSIKDEILEQFGAAQVSASEQYMRYHRIFMFGEDWDEDDFARHLHTIDSLSSQIKHMNEFKSELVGFRLHRTSGIFMVHGAGLRGMLEAIPDQSLKVMMRLLTTLAHDKCVLTSQQISTTSKALDERPTTAQSMETFEGLCNAAEAKLLETEGLCDDLEAAYRFIMKHGHRISHDHALQMDFLQTRRRDLDEVKLPQARLHLQTMNESCNALPDVVVTIHASPRGEHDWALTCNNMAGDELATLRMDLQEEVLGGFKDTLAGRLGVPAQRLQLVQADGRLLADECGPDGSMASLLGRGSLGGRPSAAADIGDTLLASHSDSPT
jgi:hypothetical protein